MFDDEGMELAGKPQIIAGAERLFAQIGEVKPRRAPACAGTLISRPSDLTAPGLPSSPPVIFSHTRSIAASAFAPVADVKDVLSRQLGLPVVLLGLQFEHLDMAFEQIDEGQKELAVQPVFIEPVRRHIGGRHHRHPAREQLLEQPLQAAWRW